jgi:hypothetical protein
MRTVATMASVCLLVGSLGSQEVSTVSASDEKIFDYLINGWKAEREKLIYGKVEMSGTRTRKNGPSESARSLFSRLIFDNAKNRKHCYTDWGGPAGWWLTAPDRMAVCLDKQQIPSLHILNPDPDPDAKRDQVAYLTEVDPRGLGACDFNWYNFGGISFRKVYTYWHLKADGITYKAIPRGDGLYDVELVQKFDNGALGRVRFRINEAKGFTFEKLEFGEKSTDDPKRLWVTAESECEWECIDDIWVPVKYKHRSEFGRDQVELSLKWLNVGGPLSDEEFDIESLGVPKGTIIIDERLGEGVILGYTKGSHEPPPLLRSDAWILKPRTIGLITAFFAIALGVATAYYWRRRKKERLTG